MIFLVTLDGKRFVDCRGYNSTDADLAEAIAWWSEVEGLDLIAVYLD